MLKFLKIFLITLGVIIGVALVFLTLLAFNEYRPDDITELSIEENIEDNFIQLNTEINILTFNMGYASLSETEDFVMDGGVKAKMDSIEEVQANLEGISTIIETQDPDIALIQEVDTDSKRSYYINQYDYLQDQLNNNSALAYNYRCIFVPFPFSIKNAMGEVNSGIVTFSDYTIDSATRISAPGSYSWPISMVHLKRCFLVTRYDISGSDKQFVVINVHLSAYDDGGMRQLQTEALLDMITEESDAGNYVLVGGDFNQTLPQGYTIVNDEIVYSYPLLDDSYWFPLAVLDEGFVDSGFDFYADATTPTCRSLDKPLDLENDSNNQYYLIDGFIVSSNITVQSVETIDTDFKYTDHNPVSIRVSLNN